MLLYDGSSSIQIMQKSVFKTNHPQQVMMDSHFSPTKDLFNLWTQPPTLPGISQLNTYAYIVTLSYRCLLCSSCYLECLPQGDPINILPFLPALAYHSFPLHCNIPTNICFSQTLLMYYILKRTPFSEVQKKEGPNDRPPKADSWGSSARAVGKGLSSPYGLIWASLQQQLTSKQEHPENRL